MKPQISVGTAQYAGKRIRVYSIALENSNPLGYKQSNDVTYVTLRGSDTRISGLGSADDLIVTFEDHQILLRGAILTDIETVIPSNSEAVYRFYSSSKTEQIPIETQEQEDKPVDPMLDDEIRVIQIDD